MKRGTFGARLEEASQGRQRERYFVKIDVKPEVELRERRIGAGMTLKQLLECGQ